MCLGASPGSLHSKGDGGSLGTNIIKRGEIITPFYMRGVREPPSPSLWRLPEEAPSDISGSLRREPPWSLPGGQI